MTDDKWDMLVEFIKQKFGPAILAREDLIVSTPDGPQKQGTQDVLEFDKSGETFRVVRENRPVVLEKKMHYSHRAGDTAQAEYVLSDSEFSHKVRVFKDDYGEWEEITLDKLGLV